MLLKQKCQLVMQTSIWLYSRVFPGLAKDKKTGHCEVVLFSKKHKGTLGSFDLRQIQGVINMWQDRSRCVGQMDHIRTCFHFSKIRVKRSALPCITRTGSSMLSVKSHLLFDVTRDGR